MRHTDLGRLQNRNSPDKNIPSSPRILLLKAAFAETRKRHFLLLASCSLCWHEAKTQTGNVGYFPSQQLGDWSSLRLGGGEGIPNLHPDSPSLTQPCSPSETGPPRGLNLDAGWPSGQDPLLEPSYLPLPQKQVATESVEGGAGAPFSADSLYSRAPFPLGQKERLWGGGTTRNPSPQCCK